VSNNPSHTFYNILFVNGNLEKYKCSSGAQSGATKAHPRESKTQYETGHDWQSPVGISKFEQSTTLAQEESSSTWLGTVSKGVLGGRDGKK
jgi:hypothetical protein